MNNLDKQYQALLQDILDNGIKKEDRTGTGTLSVFGRQIRHKMSEGFPLLTTKKMYFKGIVTELLWFLRGDTNIEFLHDNDCHIWDGDYAKSGRKDGDLGPIYGKQWRRWKIGERKLRWSQLSEEQKLTVSKEVLENTHPDVAFFADERGIDQIANIINDLKTNPDSRRLMVSAWNVGELDQMTLPPCHYGFQVYTRELNLDERAKLHPTPEMFYEIHGTFSISDSIENSNMSDEDRVWLHEQFDKGGIPKRAISLMWNQRSVDTFLGLPFNIASYGLLLEIIAKEVNMVPDELIGNLGDTHLYLNHIEQAKEQIGREMTYDEKVKEARRRFGFDHPEGFRTFDINTKESIEFLQSKQYAREPYPLPTLNIEDGVKWAEGDCLPYYSPSDFTLENYQSHPTIKAPLSN